MLSRLSDPLLEITSTFYKFFEFSSKNGLPAIRNFNNIIRGECTYHKQILSCIPICASKGWLKFSCMNIEKYHHCLLAQNGSLQGQIILKYGPIISTTKLKPFHKQR